MIGGRTREAEPLTAAAAADVDALTDEELAARLDAPHMLTLAEMYVERFDPMVAHARRAIAVARASGQGRLLAALTLAQGFGETMLGRLDDACRHLAAGVESERLTGNAHALSWVLMNHTLALTAAGELDAALAAGTESVELVDATEPGVVSAYPGAALATVLLERDRPDAAVAALVGGAGGPELPLIPGFWRVACLDLLVRAELARGHLADAERAVAVADAVAAELDQRLPAGWAARARAALALAAGEHAAAAELADAAATHLRAGGALVEAASADALAGRARAAMGDRDAAIRILEAATAELDGFGARGLRDTAARELRRLGRRGGPAAAAELSAREHEVAALAAQGLTNREIAERLVVSEKTVEGHMRRAFVKLRVRSRGELGDALVLERDHGPAPR